jgi:drug/metabolite transporter (DMT)-like permease
VSTAAGVVGALAASVCFGTAAVLQSVGARRMHRTVAVDARLLLRLTRSIPYLSGLGLDLLGFLLALTGMRRLPVFAVEALIAPYVAVTAVLAAWLLKAPLRAREWLALGGVAAGVAMLAWSAQAQPTRPVGILARSSLLATTVALGAAAACIDRVAARAATVLAFIGGLAWGLIPLATRMLRDPGSILALLSDPAAYTVAAAGALGLLLYTAALQRTGVVTATVMAILGETLLPAAAGVLVLGDQPRPGTGIVAVVGFFSTVGGALVLARCRDIEPTHTTTPP